MTDSLKNPQKLGSLVHHTARICTRPLLIPQSIGVVVTHGAVFGNQGALLQRGLSYNDSVKRIACPGLLQRQGNDMLKGLLRDA